MFNWVKKFRHQHTFGLWYVASSRLVGPYGITENPINERICSECGFRQREKIGAY